MDNLAPHSFFQVVSTEPPMVMFSSIGNKDTVKNVRASGEFVVCGTPLALLREVNRTAIEFPSEVSEFDMVSLTREPSERVGPPRVHESPYALECQCTQILTMGNGFLVFGEVVCVAVDANLVQDDKVAADRLELVARLGGTQWGTVGDVFDLPRVNLQQHHDGWDPEVMFMGTVKRRPQVDSNARQRDEQAREGQ